MNEVEVDERLPWTGEAQASPQRPETTRQAVSPPLVSDAGAEALLDVSAPAVDERRSDVERLAEDEMLRLVYKVFVTPDDRRRMVLFAGVEHDNGCVGVCVRAGKTLAALQHGLVCLVDANLRSPSLHELVGADCRYGLATAGAFPQGSVTTFARPLCGGDANNLWVLPSGSSGLDPTPPLKPASVRPRLRELCARFEHVLICAPPADSHADSLAIWQAVDGVVLVIAANATRRDAVSRVKFRFDALGVPVLGVVLNDRTYPIPRSLYRLA